MKSFENWQKYAGKGKECAYKISDNSDEGKAVTEDENSEVVTLKVMAHETI